MCAWFQWCIESKNSKSSVPAVQEDCCDCSREVAASFSWLGFSFWLMWELWMWPVGTRVVCRVRANRKVGETSGCQSSELAASNCSDDSLESLITGLSDLFSIFRERLGAFIIYPLVLNDCLHRNCIVMHTSTSKTDLQRKGWLKPFGCWTPVSFVNESIGNGLKGTRHVPLQPACELRDFDSSIRIIGPNANRHNVVM